MNREHHGKKEGTEPRAGSHSKGTPGPGKRTAVQDVEQPADADKRVATASRSTPEHLRKTVRERYLPSVKQYKDLAIEEMRENFSQVEQAGTSFLAHAIKVGAAGAAAALANAAGGGVLVTALSAGAAEAVTGIGRSFGDKGSLKTNEFCSSYGAHLQRHWFQVSGEVLDAMKDDDRAHEIHERMKSLYNRGGVVRREMREELLDAWTNALRYQNMDPSRGVGSKSFNDPTEGRLHLGPFGLAIEDRQSPLLTISGTAATMEGVPGQDARNVNLYRRLDDMRIARTVRVEWRGYDMFGGHVNFGIAPDAKREIDQLGADGEADRFAMASYYVGRRLDSDIFGPSEDGNDQKEIDANWRAGIHHIWKMMRGKTVAELGIEDIGSKA